MNKRPVFVLLGLEPRRILTRAPIRSRTKLVFFKHDVPKRPSFVDSPGRTRLTGFAWRQHASAPRSNVDCAIFKFHYHARLCCLFLCCCCSPMPAPKFIIEIRMQSFWAVGPFYTGRLWAQKPGGSLRDTRELPATAATICQRARAAFCFDKFKFSTRSIRFY